MALNATEMAEKDQPSSLWFFVALLGKRDHLRYEDSVAKLAKSHAQLSHQRK